MNAEATVPQQKSQPKKITRDWFGWLPKSLQDSPYWLTAIIFHAILLLIFAFITVFVFRPQAEVEGGIYADGGGNESVDISPPPAQTQVQQASTLNKASASQSNNDISNVIAAGSDGNWTVAQASADVSPIAATANISGTGKGIPGAYSARLGGAGGRRKFLSGISKPDEVEAAVNNALKWLKRHQNDDGSWGEDFKPGMTGLAVLCYLAHGDLQGTPEYGSTVEKGVKFLISEGDSHGGMMGQARNEYQHAIASLALAENYAMAPTLTDVETAAKRSITLIVKGQDGGGGYAYGYAASGGHVDTSVSGWNIQALEAAHLGSMEVDGLDAAIDKAKNYLKNQYNDGAHSFGYTNANDWPNWEKRGVGVYNLQLLLDKVEDGKKEWEKTPQVTKSLDALMKDDAAKFDWQNGKGWVLYGWYYNTYMSFFGGKEHWSYWNNQYRQQLIKQQVRDGHWPLPPGDATAGSIPKLNDSDVYSTTLCCLMLQVFWRHLTTG